MKIEIINVTPKEQRILLLFDASNPSTEQNKVDDYLRTKHLEPKRQYHEERDGKDHLVYYFGHCYIEKHLEALKACASEANV